MIKQILINEPDLAINLLKKYSGSRFLISPKNDIIKDMQIYEPNLAKYLLDNFLGKRLYVPKGSLEEAKILKDIIHLRGLGYDESQLINSISQSYFLTKKYTSRKIKSLTNKYLKE